MSNASIANPAGSQEQSEPRKRRHWLSEAMRDTAKRAGARFGLLWVIAIALLAVFAPFIANSYPLLAKQDGQWSSPLIENLAWIDVTLLAGFVLFILLYLARNVSFDLRLLVFVAGLMVIATTCWFTVKPSERQIYDQYRQLQAEGKLDYALWTLVPYSPSDRMRDRSGQEHPLQPMHNNWLGTGRYGSDVTSKMIHATRIALVVGFIAEGISLVVGVIIGGFMGYFAGWVDLLGLRLVEVFSAIPRLFLLLAFVAVFGRNIFLIMAIIGITGWTGHAYFARAEFLRLRNQDFVAAARATGTPLYSILFRHMLPNGMAPLLVSAGFGVASAILYEATLSFLGLGVVDQPSWGDMLNQAVADGGGFYWWLATFPGLAIFMSVFAFNLIGEALRDSLDPKSAQRM